MFYFIIFHFRTTQIRQNGISRQQGIHYFLSTTSIAIFKINPAVAYALRKIACSWAVHSYKRFEYCQIKTDLYCSLCSFNSKIHVIDLSFTLVSYLKKFVNFNINSLRKDYFFFPMKRNENHFTTLRWPHLSS